MMQRYVGQAAYDPSSTGPRREYRWLLLALLSLVLAFVIGFATESAHAAQDKLQFKTEAVEERECVKLQVRPKVMMPTSSGDIQIEARIACRSKPTNSSTAPSNRMCTHIHGARRHSPL